MFGSVYLNIYGKYRNSKTDSTNELNFIFHFHNINMTSVIRGRDNAIERQNIFFSTVVVN